MQRKLEHHNRLFRAMEHEPVRACHYQHQHQHRLIDRQMRLE